MQISDQQRREHLLLSKLPSGSSKTFAKLAPVKLPAYFSEVGFSDRSAIQTTIADLVQRGFVQETKKSRSAHFTITEAGGAYLNTLPVPPKIERGASREERPLVEVAEDAVLRPYQDAFLLLQVLIADGKVLTEGVANKLTKSIREDLELTPTLASQLRRKLAALGFLQLEKAGPRSVHLSLTDEGLMHLSTMRHHTAATFSVTGLALNKLLDAAGTERGSSLRLSPPPADLGKAVYAILLDLTRERHSRDRLVPIFEIRREIARKFGADSARHDVLDEHIFGLWKKGQARLISISDLRMANEIELSESISDSYETLFYMEATDGHGNPR